MKDYRITKTANPELEPYSDGFNKKTLKTETKDYRANSIKRIWGKLILNQDENGYEESEEILLNGDDKDIKIEKLDKNGNWVDLPLHDNNGDLITSF